MTYPQENLDLEISEPVFRSVMGILQDASLSAKERVYLSYITGRAGRQGVIFHQQQTLARDLGFSIFTVCRIEKKLQHKGRLKVFGFEGRTYRSPYVQEVETFFSVHTKPAPEATVTQIEPASQAPEPPEQNCKSHVAELQVPLAQTASAPSSYQQLGPAAKAAEIQVPPPPKRTCTKESSTEINPVQGKHYHQQQNQRVITPPVDNSTDWFTRKAKTPTKPTKNPFRKDRRLVQYVANDLAERLEAWDSWGYIAKLVWNICEEGEQWLYQAASWVREEAECGRCRSKIGLFDWKLAEMGSHPLKA